MFNFSDRTVSSVAGRLADTRFLSKNRRHYVKVRKGRPGYGVVFWESAPGDPQIRIGIVRRSGRRLNWDVLATFEGRLNCLASDVGGRDKAAQILADYYARTIRPPTEMGSPEEGEAPALP